MRRLLSLLSLSVFLLLVAAPLAIADDPLEPVSGEGTYGVADDKVVTNAGFIIIITIPLFLLAMTLLQARLDRRKDERKAAAKKLKSGTSVDWQSGW